METILLSLILAIGLVILYFQIKNKPKQEENVSEKIKDELVKGRKRFIQKVFNNINSSSEQHNEIMLKLISDKNSTK